MSKDRETVIDVLKKLYRIEKYNKVGEVEVVDDCDEWDLGTWGDYEVIDFIYHPGELDVIFKYYSEISNEVKSKYDRIFLRWTTYGYKDSYSYFEICGSRLETDEEYNKRLDGIKKSEEKKKKQRESKKKRVLEKKIEQFEKLKKEIAAAQEKG